MFSDSLKFSVKKYSCTWYYKKWNKIAIGLIYGYCLGWWYFPLGLLIGIYTEINYTRPYIPAKPGPTHIVLIKILALVTNGYLNSKQKLFLENWMQNKYPNLSPSFYMFHYFDQLNFRNQASFLYQQWNYHLSKKKQLLEEVIQGVISRDRDINRYTDIVAFCNKTFKIAIAIEQEVSEEIQILSPIEEALKLLGIAHDYTEISKQEIKKAYADAIKAIHPDTSNTKSKEQGEQIMKIKIAFRDINVYFGFQRKI